jgi:hypothetical protein
MVLRQVYGYAPADNFEAASALIFNTGLFDRSFRPQEIIGVGR